MTTRPRGEGAVYQRADGRWRAEVTVGWDAGGRRRRRYLSGRTKAEVTRKLRDALADRDAGTLTAGTSTTVESWLRHWLEHMAEPRVRESTLRTYAGYVDNWLIPELGRIRLDKLAPEHLEQLYGRMAGQGLSVATRLQVHRILHRALKVAGQRGRVNRNVAALVDAPSVQRAEVKPLTAAGARSVLTAAAAGRNAARWSVALALGLRQGEALGCVGTTSTSTPAA